MGTLFYYGLNAEQAKQDEMRGCEILDRSGNWFVYKQAIGTVGLVYFKVTSQRNGTAVKPIEIQEGPRQRLPKRIAKSYLSHHGDDFDEAGGRAGAPILRAALGADEASA
jgi:hypothetical protein